MTSHGYKQNEISQELSMGAKIIKTSYYTVLRGSAFSFKENKNLCHFKCYKNNGVHARRGCHTFVDVYSYLEFVFCCMLILDWCLIFFVI
jgi:hypothetical protein